MNHLDVPCRVSNIYEDKIEDFTLVCTPLAMNGIHLLTPIAKQIFNQCDGLSSIRDIIQSTGYSDESVFGTINALWRNSLIKINGKISLPIAKKNSLARIEVWFHITNHCNLRCPYCYIKKTNESMSKETAFLAVDNLIASALKHNIPTVRIKFTGGEPLLCFSLMKEVVDYGKKRSKEKSVKISFHLLTNGTLVSKDIAKYLKKESITVSLSLDGTAESHNRLRYYVNGLGTFNRIEKTLDIFGEYGIFPYILTTISALNLYDIPNLTDYLLEKEFSFRYSLYRELGVSEKSLKNYNDDVVKILHQCYDIFEENLPERDFFSVHQLCDIKLTKSRKRACGIGTKGINIDHKGRIAICQAVFDNPVGNIIENDALTVIRNQNQFKANYYSINNYEYCGDCHWQYLCNGGCPVLTKLQYGRFDTRSPYCEVFKECIPRLIRIAGLQIFKDYSRKYKLKGGEENGI